MLVNISPLLSMKIETLHKPVPFIDESSIIKGEIFPLLFKTILEKLSIIR